jgi:hypothetical protein
LPVVDVLELWELGNFFKPRLLVRLTDVTSKVELVRFVAVLITSLSLKRPFKRIGVDRMGIAVVRINCNSPSAVRLWLLVKGMVKEVVIWRRNVVWMRNWRFQT